VASTPGYVIEVDGLAKLIAELGESVVESEVVIQKALDTAAYLVGADQRKLMKKKIKLPLADRTGSLLQSAYVNTAGKLAEVGIRGEGAGGVRYYGWWEFGGDNQSPRGASYREYLSTGRTLYPALGMNQAKIRTLMEAAAAKIAKRYL
jgi:hypothetical protein